MNQVSLRKITDKGNIRYYNIEIIATLFDEFIVERVYGNIRFKTCTGKKSSIFPNYNEAQHFFEKIKRQKIKRGYI